MTVKREIDDTVTEVPRQHLPAGVADLPPGVELAQLLAGVDLSRLNGHDLIEVAPAVVRMISHYQAQLAQLVDQVDHCPPGHGDSPAQRIGHTNQWAQIDLAARLHWTAGRAEHELRYAAQLARLPMVRDALAAGELDWSQAKMIIHQLMFIGDQPAWLLANGILAAGASQWNSRQIGYRLRKAVLAFEPAAAERRRQQRQAERRVDVSAHPDGTADLAAVNLPPDRVAAMLERVTAIAATAKRHGDPRTLRQLEADVVADLLAGTGIGATPAEAVTNPGPTGHPDHLTDVEPLHDDEGEQHHEPDHHPEPAEQPWQAESAGQAQAEDQPVAALPVPRKGVVNLTASLSTVLGWSDQPGELEGFGPVTAQVIRNAITQMSDIAWRISLYDDLGGCPPACHGDCPGGCGTGQLVHHSTIHRRTTRPAQGDPGRRNFTAADIAFVQTRDRTCNGPQGCHRPATECDTDHSVPRADGGTHTLDNAGPLCRREHMYRHQSGAHLQQLRPGIFKWTTQFGHSYTIRPDPYDETSGLATHRLQRLQRQLEQLPANDSRCQAP